MEKAITIAIENGWKPDQRAQFVIFNRSPIESYRIQCGDHFCLSPLFWQALGKGLGWNNCWSCGKTKEVHTHNNLCPTGEERVATADVKTYVSKTWKHEWQNFVGHLAEGKDIESYFINLIK